MQYGTVWCCYQLTCSLNLSYVCFRDFDIADGYNLKVSYCIAFTPVNRYCRRIITHNDLFHCQKKKQWPTSAAVMDRLTPESAHRPNSSSSKHKSAHNNEDFDEPDFWDKISQYSIKMKKDFRFYFQHPYSRLLIAYLVTFCNFLIYAEDPVAHSSAECNIVVVGNIFSFVFTKYPANGFSVLKVFLWMSAIILGCILGKLVIHKLLLSKSVFLYSMVYLS